MLMNGRWLPMGLAVGPFLSGGPLKRAAQSLALVDASFALSSRGDGTYDRGVLIGATLPQAAAWTGGTLIGVLIGPALGDPGALGLDAMFPAFFAVLLAGEARGKLPMTAAATGGVIALALMPVRAARRARPGRASPRCSACVRRERRAPASARCTAQAVARRSVMTAVWITIAALTVGTFATKAVGPLVLGARPPGERMLAMTGLVAPALLAALVVYETLSRARPRHHARRARRRARRGDPGDPRCARRCSW